MKRLLTLVVTLLMIFSIAACSKSEPAGSNPQGSEKAGQEETGQTEQLEQQEQTAQSGTSSEVNDGRGILCENYAAFKEARDKFNEYVLEQSNSHEVVSVNLPVAVVFDANIFEYILPLDFMGQSLLAFGKFDAEMETGMLQTAWAKDAEYTYNQDAGYLLKGTSTAGNKLEMKVIFDEAANSLRLECYKDGAIGLVFEYMAIDGGYAAQYYLEGITGYDKATPVRGLCTYKLIFSGENGSWARYDNVASEPESILGSTPDQGSFIDGAAHWFTINNGQFKGNLSGKEF